MMPLFTNSIPEVDGDGNVLYDLRPMVGAYAVAIVKYVALFCLHGGVLAICTSMFMITPENARRAPEVRVDIWRITYYLTVTIIVVLIAMLLSSAKVIGLAVKL